jgi:DNA-binding NtrC family response regulator
MALPKLLMIADQAVPHLLAPEIHEGFEVSRASSLAHAAQILQEEQVTHGAILVAGEMPGHDKIDVLEALRTANPDLPLVFFDPSLTALEAVRLVRNGAHQCFGTGDTQESLAACLLEACEQTRRRQRAKKASDDCWSRLLVGESRALDDVKRTIGLVAQRRCTILITGETGTGKEMAARALHMASPRAQSPMVAVNCSALPENLLEAELFGHVKGAFTGATSNRIGRFEQADRSTIFLDEIGEMPLDLQSKLLRVLQERELQRLGSSETIHVDVRVVAASNSNLAEKIRQGKFRQDLYYRLNVVPLRMPALRERRGDIPMLVDHFVAKVCRNEGLPLKWVTPEAKSQLRGLAWPGNVRQLENMVEMAVAVSDDRDALGCAEFGLAPELLDAADLEMPAMAPVGGMPMRFETAVSNFERSILNMALSKTGGNKTAAAELLGMKRTTLVMKLRGLQAGENLLAQAV